MAKEGIAASAAPHFVDDCGSRQKAVISIDNAAPYVVVLTRIRTRRGAGSNAAGQRYEYNQNLYTIF